MSNLANTFSKLGRHEDALAMQEKTLDFQRRVLPAHHTSLGVACFNISISHENMGNLHSAIEMAHEALRIFQATLPPSNPYVQRSQLRLRLMEGDAGRRQ